MEHCDWPGPSRGLLGVCKITFTQMAGNGDRFGPQRKDAEQHAVIAPHGLMEMWRGELGCGEPSAQHEQKHQCLVALVVSIMVLPILHV